MESEVSKWSKILLYVPKCDALSDDAFVLFLRHVASIHCPDPSGHGSDHSRHNAESGCSVQQSSSMELEEYGIPEGTSSGKLLSTKIHHNNFCEGR